MKNTLIAVAALLLGAQTFAAAKSIEFSADKGAVKFLAIGKPAAIKINGSGEAAHGTLSVSDDKKISGVLTFNLKSLTTGIDLRDKHMKEKYLQVDQYPDAQLTIKDLTIPDEILTAVAEKGTAEKDIPFTGKLKLKGVEKDVQGTAHVKKSGGNLDVSAQFSLKLDDFGVDIPKYLGITVANEVRVDVSSNPAVKE